MDFGDACGFFNITRLVTDNFPWNAYAVEKLEETQTLLDKCYKNNWSNPNQGNHYEVAWQIIQMCFYREQRWQGCQKPARSSHQLYNLEFHWQGKNLCHLPKDLPKVCTGAHILQPKCQGRLHSETPHSTKPFSPSFPLFLQLIEGEI